MKIGAHETHPAADVCPMMDDEQIANLAVSIKHDGLLTKIVLLVEDEFPDGRILDGRNRYRACIKAGVEPEFKVIDNRVEQMDMGDLCRFVDAINLRRRHLTGEAAALSSRRLVKLCRVRKEREKYQAVLQMGEADHVTDMVLADGTPELVRAVEVGDVPMDIAAEVSKLEPDEQARVLEQMAKPERVKLVEARKSVAIELSLADQDALNALVALGESNGGQFRAGAKLLRKMVGGV